MKILVKIKKYILVLLIVLSGFLFACGESKNTESRSMFVGEVIQLDCEDTYEFISSDTSVAIVSSEGIVKALSAGKATISITNEINNYELQLDVVDNNLVVKLTYNCKQTLNINEEMELNAKVINSNESFVYSYLSSDENIASVSSTGKVTGVSTGICEITIKAIGSIQLEKTMFVLVKDVNESSGVINNVIENKTYEIIGDIDLTKLNKQVVDVVDKTKNSVVGVSNYQYVQNFMQKQLEEVSVGTGCIFASEYENNTYTYYVLTNHHVIEDNVQLKIYFGYDDKYIDASLINSNSNLDLAVVSFTSKDVYDLLEFGDISTVHDGDFAIAIGNSNGYEYFGSVTFGVISYTNRKLTGEQALFLQHDVAINPGNSGGPLFNLEGKIIGINTLKIVESDVDNMGFSISVDTVKSYLKTLGFNY